MKLSFLLLVIILLTFACNKDTPVDYSTVIGKWELRASVGGIAGIIRYQAGNGNTIVYNADRTFVGTNISPSGTKITNGNYSLANVGNGDLFITYSYQANNQITSFRDSVRIQHDSLFSLPFATCCDIAGNIYVKLK